MFEGSQNTFYMAVTILGLLIAVTLIIIYIKVLSPYFEEIFKNLTNSERKNKFAIKRKKDKCL